VLLFAGLMIVLWRTNKVAFSRQTRELDSKETEAKADGASALTDQFVTVYRMLGADAE
jgi:hypothetical protein